MAVCYLWRAGVAQSVCAERSGDRIPVEEIYSVTFQAQTETHLGLMH
jgi:hypothetical protein